MKGNIDKTSGELYLEPSNENEAKVIEGLVGGLASGVERNEGGATGRLRFPNYKRLWAAYQTCANVHGIGFDADRETLRRKDFSILKDGDRLWSSQLRKRYLREEAGLPE